MKESVFGRESEVIKNAHQLLLANVFEVKRGEQSYRELLAEYEKLVRQSKRLLKMSDRMQREMSKLARTDSLTGLWNRGYFVELAAQELARSKRSQHDMSILLIDVDHFKRINDVYGHDMGDKALIGLAKALKKSLREVDVVARFGGEEFVVMLPETHMESAYVAAGRVLEGIRELNFSDEQDEDVSVTVSIGVTSFQDMNTDLDLLLKRADNAMYVAKRNGRNRVERCLELVI